MVAAASECEDRRSRGQRGRHRPLEFPAVVRLGGRKGTNLVRVHQGDRGHDDQGSRVRRQLAGGEGYGHRPWRLPFRPPEERGGQRLPRVPGHGAGPRPAGRRSARPRPGDDGRPEPAAGGGVRAELVRGGTPGQRAHADRVHVPVLCRGGELRRPGALPAVDRRAVRPGGAARRAQTLVDVEVPPVRDHPGGHQHGQRERVQRGHRRPEEVRQPSRPDPRRRPKCRAAP